MNTLQMVPAAAPVTLTWGTRLFCHASRRESLPLATIWSFYLHLAGEPQNTNCVRERLTPEASRKQAVSQILSGRRRALLAAWGFLRFSDTITLIVL